MSSSWPPDSLQWPLPLFELSLNVKYTYSTLPRAAFSLDTHWLTFPCESLRCPLLSSSGKHTMSCWYFLPRLQLHCVPACTEGFVFHSYLVSDVCFNLVNIDLNVSCFSHVPTALLQAETSQQLLDGLPFSVSRWYIPLILLTFSLAVDIHVFLMTRLFSYWMDCL